MKEQSRWRDHIIAAEGYLDLGMTLAANEELERMPAEDRSRPEVYALRLKIYIELKKWDLAEVCAKHLTKIWPDQKGWWCAWAFATRQAVSIEGAEKTLIQARVRFPEDALIYYNLACYASVMGRWREAKYLLAEAIIRDDAYQMRALEDEDMQPIWDEIAGME